jgi:hypothetical protein
MTRKSAAPGANSYSWGLGKGGGGLYQLGLFSLGSESPWGGGVIASSWLSSLVDVFLPHICLVEVSLAENLH